MCRSCGPGGRRGERTHGGPDTGRLLAKRGSLVGFERRKEKLFKNNTKAKNSRKVESSPVIKYFVRTDSTLRDDDILAHICS